MSWPPAVHVATVPGSSVTLADLRAFRRIDPPEADPLAGPQLERVAVENAGRRRTCAGRDDEQDQGERRRYEHAHLSFVLPLGTT
jgi:hypothetical protein